MIFPIITFPYAARVLMPEGIGLVNFQNSIIGYIVLLTSLGIPLYAIREIAKCRDDHELRDRTTVEITLLSVLLSFIGYVLVWLLGEYVPRIHEGVILFYILSLTIIFTGLGVQWFYQGIEDFLFITVRGLIVRFLCAISLFVFVKEKDDLLVYALIIVGSTVGNNLINFIHLRKFLHLRVINWNKLNILRHVKPAFQVFLLNVVSSIYLQLNTIMLGFMTDDRTVGVFTSGTKITHIFAVIMASLSTVLLPRCSYLINEGKLEEYGTVVKKSYNLQFLMTIPISMIVLMLARPITICFCGEEYIDSIPVVMITAPTIIIACLSNLIGFQVLYPLGKEMLFVIATLIAALFNILINFFLIPLFEGVGAAISTLITEIVVLIGMISLGKKYMMFSLLDKQIGLYFLSTIVLMIVVLPCLFMSNLWLQMLLIMLIAIIIYLSILYLAKDQLFREILDMITCRKK